MVECLEEKKGSVVVFSLKGYLDSTSSPEVEKKILSSIDSGTMDIILDMSSLDYISSAGIRILVLCLKTIEKRGGKICLVSVPKPIENVLYITGFLQYFKLYDNQKQALEALSSK